MANEILWEHALTQLPSEYQWQLQPPISQNLMTANFPKPFSETLLKLDIASVRLWDSAKAVRSDFPLATPPLNLPQGIRLRYFGEGYPGCSPGPEARDCPRQP